MKDLNLDKLNNLIKDTGKIIEEDPLKTTWAEIDALNSDFEDIYNNLAEQGWTSPEKPKNFFASLISKWATRDPDFAFKNFEEKIDSIFSQFDNTYEGAKSSIKILDTFRKSLSKEVQTLDKELKKIDTEALGEDESIQYKAYSSLLEILKGNLLRIEERHRASVKIANAMKINRPMFQALLSSVLIEVSGQMAIEGSVKTLEVMSGTIAKMTDQLTEGTIKLSKFAMKAEMQPLLCAPLIQESMLKLGGALEDIKKEKDALILTAWKHDTWKQWKQ